MVAQPPTKGENLLSELHRRSEFWGFLSYAERQSLRDVDSTESLTQFLHSHGLADVPVSDDMGSVADDILDVLAAQGRRSFRRDGILFFVIAIAILVSNIYEGSMSGYHAVVVAFLVLVGFNRFRMVRMSERMDRHAKR